MRDPPLEDKVPGELMSHLKCEGWATFAKLEVGRKHVLNDQTCVMFSLYFYHTSGSVPCNICTFRSETMFYLVLNLPSILLSF